ncbi:MAG: putative Fe2+ transport system protein, subunit A [Promethearchaeota archaeon]|nr:MAG: putative Fe2+ transport system protein, subunit A [Candidatus Lokiarchaeota archaeon]
MSYNMENQQRTTLRKCLTECDKGAELKVVRVNAGHRAKRRLANLGIVPGSIIRKQRSAPFRGPLQLIVKGSSIVIGRGLADKVIVECRDDSCAF